jgi:hypothetical protein
MTRYLIIHNKHEGCYDFQCYEDPVARMRLTSITINPPKIFMFNTREQAQDFFEEYINDVDVLDIRCKKGDDVEHIDYCTCGIIELDEEENPILFYNKKNQIFLLENGPQVFGPPHELKEDIKNYNLTNKLIRKCRTLTREQRKRYIELGKYCEECNNSYDSNDEDKDKDKDKLNIDKNEKMNLDTNEKANNDLNNKANSNKLNDILMINKSNLNDDNKSESSTEKKNKSTKNRKRNNS